MAHRLINDSILWAKAEKQDKNAQAQAHAQKTRAQTNETIKCHKSDVLIGLCWTRRIRHPVLVQLMEAALMGRSGRADAEAADGEKTIHPTTYD